MGLADASERVSRSRRKIGCQGAARYDDEDCMGYSDFLTAQAANTEGLAAQPHFASLVPLVDRMYRCVCDIAGPKFSPTLVKLLVLSHREMLVAATQIQRGLPYDAAANTRRAIEIAKVALAAKRDFANAEKWLMAAKRQERWDARQQGVKPPWLPGVQFSGLENEPLLTQLQEFYGIASDMYVHFTPEFFGQEFFNEKPGDGNALTIESNYFADERTVLQHALMLCSLHVRIMLVFDACFDGAVIHDAGWKMLAATFEQLSGELARTLPPDGGLKKAGAGV